MTKDDKVQRFLEHVPKWAARRPDIVAVGLVGSRARGEAREDSDVDLILLTARPGLYTPEEGWIEGLAPAAELVRTANWGAVVARRLRLRSGLEVDVGIGEPSWASIDRLDPGSRRVVKDGLRPLYDPSRLLERLRTASLHPGSR